MEHKKHIIASIVLSVFFHTCAFIFVQKYPASTTYREKKLAIKQDVILRDAFKTIEKATVAKAAQPQIEKTVHLPSPPSTPTPEQTPMAALRTQHIEFSLDKLVNPTIATAPLFVTKWEPFNLLEHLPKEIIIPQFNPTSLPSFVENSEKVTFQSAASYNPCALVIAESPAISHAIQSIAIPIYPSLPTLSELDTASYSHAFDMEISFVPKDDESGYIFAITLIPKPELDLLRIPQHVTFLVDRANSIQQERLHATKNAILKSLEELTPEDTFNIIVFDNKMEKMAPQSVPVSSKSLTMAERFLEKVQLGSFFSSTDLYRPLLLTVPSSVEDQELHTAILFTDAESFGKKPAQRAILSDWTEFNSGKVALFALGLTDDAHTGTLDAATVFNRGRLYQATTYKGLKRKLLKLMKTIQSPIAKDLSCKAIALRPNSHIQLFGTGDQTPHLYQEQPYVILGETDSLDDFVLFVQGRLKNRWINIKKTISFLPAKKGNKALRKEWAIHCAYDLYKQYVQDNNAKHLADAAAILEPYDCELAFR